MRIYKNKLFSRWAAREKISDKALTKAVAEIDQGLVEANLGGNLYKKRVAVEGKGKSGGVRTLLAYRFEERAFFIYGFAKNARSNIHSNEEKALKRYAAELMAYSDNQLKLAVKSGALIEVKIDG